MNLNVSITGTGSYVPQEIATPADLVDPARIISTKTVIRQWYVTCGWSSVGTSEDNRPVAM